MNSCEGKERVKKWLSMLETSFEENFKVTKSYLHHLSYHKIIPRTGVRAWRHPSVLLVVGTASRASSGTEAGKESA